MYVYQQILLFTCTLATVNCLMFRLPANSKRCLKEEIHKGVLVSGEYELTDAPGAKTDLMVS